jgi:hypothetical protein
VILVIGEFRLPPMIIRVGIRCWGGHQALPSVVPCDPQLPPVMRGGNQLLEVIRGCVLPPVITARCEHRLVIREGVRRGNFNVSRFLHVEVGVGYTFWRGKRASQDLCRLFSRNKTF